MAGTSQFVIGTEVSCGDGAVGKVSRVMGKTRSFSAHAQDAYLAAPDPGFPYPL